MHWFVQLSLGNLEFLQQTRCFDAYSSATISSTTYQNSLFWIILFLAFLLRSLTSGNFQGCLEHECKLTPLVNCTQGCFLSLMTSITLLHHLPRCNQTYFTGVHSSGEPGWYISFCTWTYQVRMTRTFSRLIKIRMLTCFRGDPRDVSNIRSKIECAMQCMDDLSCTGFNVRMLQCQPELVPMSNTRCTLWYGLYSVFILIVIVVAISS